MSYKARCERCRNREDFCKCVEGPKIVTREDRKHTNYTCAVDGCSRGGCVSPDTVAPMRWLCREHATEEMGMDFTPNESCKNAGDAMKKRGIRVVRLA